MPNDLADEFDSGDVVWVEFGAPFGHEQAGRRPALVVSPLSYNKQSSLILVCPITRNVSPWPFKVDMPPTGRIRGAVLADQVRPIDWRARFVRWAERVDLATVANVHEVIAALMGIRKPQNP